MDATHWFQFRFFILLGPFSTLVLLNTACGNRLGSVNSEQLNGQECVGQAVPNSFLVKWNGSVPAKYTSNRVGPNSLVTRFRNMEKADVERNILQRHLTEYAIAEPEFYIQNVLTSGNKGSVGIGHQEDSTPVNGAWGPSDIQASDAWNYLGEKGDGVIVAVVDSGIDVNHPLLQNQLWVNTGEIPNNGIDDDHDGYVDDYNGYNFNTDSSDLTDGADHGTHVSGIIAGQAGADNFTGIAPNAKIMPLKFIDSTGNGAVGDAIAAMEYAQIHGAQVINASWGGSECSSVLQEQIMTATSSGMVFVNAAGNSGDDINVQPEWPAVFQIPGKITVASYNNMEVLSTFSNFGVLVDLAAPGENILSTVPPSTGQTEGQLAYKSGTSMATPFISGVAALLFSARPKSTALQIVGALNGGVTIEGFNVRTQGKINALGAATYLMSH